MPLKTRYCQAITFANWRMGTVQNSTKLDDNDGHRLLSVKLRDGLLVTLAEVIYIIKCPIYLILGSNINLYFRIIL
jgi:hypothetical protein